MLANRLLLAGSGAAFTIPLPTDFTAFYNRQVGASTYRIFAAASTDGGESFTTGDTALIDIGAGGSWNDVHLAHPCAIEEDGAYAMYVSGYDGSTWRTGRYTAATLSTTPGGWTADPANPIISPTGGLTGTWVPQCQPDTDLELTRIWYLAYNGTTFSTYYAERDWATGTITKYGEVLPPGGSGAWNELGTDAVVPHTIGGQKRLFLGGQAADGVSEAGWASYTDPRVAATYTNHGSILAGPFTADDGDYLSPAILSLQPYGVEGYLVFGSLIHPDGFPANSREISFRTLSPDGLTFPNPIAAPIIPMATSWPDSESRENPNVHLTP